VQATLSQRKIDALRLSYASFPALARTVTYVFVNETGRPPPQLSVDKKNPHCCHISLKASISSLSSQSFRLQLIF